MALAFTEELTAQVDDIRYATNKHGVSDKTLQMIKHHFTDEEISELAVNIGLWNALSRFHRVMDFDLDMPPPPPELDAAL